MVKKGGYRPEIGLAAFSNAEAKSQRNGHRRSDEREQFHDHLSSPFM
jgi:hypothetical protein